MEEVEIRSFGENAAPQVTEGRTVEGYAIVFNYESRVLYSRAKRRQFIEVIEPRAVTEEFLNNCDIKMNRNHNDDILLARSHYGSGSLHFEIDEYGVKYRFEMPDTPTGNDTLESIRRGDLFGSSFRFVDAADGVKVEKLPDGMYKRTVVKFADIRDFSIVADPAYYGTFVNARSLGEDDEPDRNDTWKEELAQQCAGIDSVEI